MPGDYEKIDWTEDEDGQGNPLTPLSAENLNHMEEGIKNLDDYLNIDDIVVDESEEEETSVTITIVEGEGILLYYDLNINAPEADLIEEVELRVDGRTIETDTSTIDTDFESSKVYYFESSVTVFVNFEDQGDCDVTGTLKILGFEEST